jgi:hypothetical protein
MRYRIRLSNCLRPTAATAMANRVARGRPCGRCKKRPASIFLTYRNCASNWLNATGSESTKAVTPFCLKGSTRRGRSTVLSGRTLRNGVRMNRTPVVRVTLTPVRMNQTGRVWMGGTVVRMIGTPGVRMSQTTRAGVRMILAGVRMVRKARQLPIRNHVMNHCMNQERRRRRAKSNGIGYDTWGDALIIRVTQARTLSN